MSLGHTNRISGNIYSGNEGSTRSGRPTRSTRLLARGVNHFVEHVRDVLLRGGRMTKVNGQAASYAPSFAGMVSTGFAGLGAGFAGLAGLTGLAGNVGSAIGRTASRLAASTSAGALAVAMMAAVPVVSVTGTAEAGSCGPVVGPGIFYCSGVVTGGDVTQVLGPVGGNLTVTTSADFAITTAVGDALTLTGRADWVNLSFDDLGNANAITGAYTGIYAVNYGTGATLITTTGYVYGAGGRGIHAINTTAGTGLTIEAAATTGAVHGIEAANSGAGDLSITVNGDVEGGTAHGILAENDAANSTGSMLITQVVGTTITAIASGITASNQTGSVIINAYGTSDGDEGYGIYAGNGTYAT
ncbi:MAG: hypothetical protein GY927_21280, partial [bacterium]|nr:hypothetical protein [bacterium]